MGYEITIRCDVGKGDPAAKRTCLTFDRHGEVPRFEASTSRDAAYGIERVAEGWGWKRRRRQGRSTIWICPVCQAAAARCVKPAEPTA